MKFGLVFHKNTANLGDDVQAYAQSCFLPHIDYYIDREYISEFQSKDNEPVAGIFAAWWMWNKWSWPPSECIYPLITSFHITKRNEMQGASPVFDHFLSGVGGEYFKSYGPVGGRDIQSVKIFESNKIPCFFSGCLTLTLPKQERTSDAGTYICLVDVRKDLEDIIRKKANAAGLEVRTYTHEMKPTHISKPWKRRAETVKRMLTIYQNARCVISCRLHVGLPCLAMEVPFFNIMTVPKSKRKSPYQDWFHNLTIQQILTGDLGFDLVEPPANTTAYLPVRQALIKQVKEFVAHAERMISIDEFKKTTYSEYERIVWQNELMCNALEKWLIYHCDSLEQLQSLEMKVRESGRLKAQIGMKLDYLFIEFRNRAIARILKQRARMRNVALRAETINIVAHCKNALQIDNEAVINQNKTMKRLLNQWLYYNRNLIKRLLYTQKRVEALR